MTENDSEQRLTPKQDALIAALLAGLSMSAAVKALSIGEKTAYRWLKLPHFQRAYRDAQKDMFEQALTGLLHKVDKAIATLDRNMSSEDAPPSTQVRAAQLIIENAISIHKMSELEQKVVELEQVLKTQGKM